MSEVKLSPKEEVIKHCRLRGFIPYKETELQFEEAIDIAIRKTTEEIFENIENSHWLRNVEDYQFKGLIKELKKKYIDK